MFEVVGAFVEVGILEVVLLLLLFELPSVIELDGFWGVCNC
jgi:hypothetical protein